MDTRELLEWAAKYHTPNYARAPICLVRGDGVRVWDSDGKEYLDFGAGLAVAALGHCHPRVTGAIREAAATLLHVSNLYYTAPQIHLAKLLCDHSFAERVFFCNSGAEANEAAPKVARKYAKERYASDRYEVIATHNSFHGRTFATVTATGQEKYRQGFEPLVPGFKHVPYNDLRAMARALDDRTAAIIVEPIQGEGGVNVPDDDYLPGLRKLCDESGTLLILDEIQTGVARTGRLWAYEHAGVEPDIMTLAKALANGVPIGAMLAKEAVARALTPGTHATTFGGTPFVASVAIATLTALLDEKLPERAARMGRRLMERLRAVQRKHAFITDVRGRGLLIGVEMSRPVAPLIAACRGARAVYLAAHEVGLGTRESVPDVARNLSLWVDGIVARVYRHDTVASLAQHADVPVFNALSDHEHPCEALADYFTLWERGLDLSRTHVAWVGDGNNVCHSLLLMGALLGTRLTAACPPGYEPSAEVQATVRRLGGRLDLTADPREAATGADVLYTDVWTSMGQESEREQRLRVFQRYQINEALVRCARPTAVVMHCLPAHRGEEITDSVLDGPQSVVLDQSANRLHAQKAGIREFVGDR